MELGDATVLMDTSSGEALPAGGEGREGGGGEEEVERINLNGGGGGGGGNRWPRQETLALLKIRSDMDGVFRDASLKGPLWEEVSRKLAQLGYQRSAKKCKEKFENVYKYHRRTKESRSGKSEGKTYRFFDQLQALEKPFTLSSYPPKPSPATTLPITTNPPLTLPSTDPISHVSTVPSTNPTTLISPSPPTPTNATTNIISTTLTTNPTNPSQENNNISKNNNNNGNNVQYSLPNMNLFSTTTTTTTSTSSSTASDEDLEEKYRKKRKWKDYFRRLTREVLAKQEEMQKRFLESIDKREREHMAQQDAWRLQEMARINREHDLLVQERSTAAAKNAAVIAFLQKLSTQNTTTPPPPPPQQQQPRTPPPSQPPQQQQPPLTAPSQPPISQPQVPHNQPLVVIPQPNNNVEVKAMSNGHRNSGSRWPKPEVQALIRLRTSLEPKYLENGPKAPLWEDISAGMQRLGYNRSSKRCKEKWENINKYFKKVKESNKQRREDSKTCPYFHELEALYKEKGKTQNPFGSGSLHNMKQNEMMEPLMVQPEQQWRPPPAQESNVEEKKNEEVVAEGGEEDYDDEDDNEYESMEEDEQGYDDEVRTNKLSSVDIVE